MDPPDLNRNNVGQHLGQSHDVSLGILARDPTTFKSLSETTLTFFNVSGFAEQYPSPADIPEIVDGFLLGVRIDSNRFHYNTSELLAAVHVAKLQDSVTRSAHEFLGYMQQVSMRQSRGSYNASSSIVICAVDIGATIVKEALFLAGTDPLHRYDELFGRVTLVAFFGSLHCAKDISESLTILSSLVQTCREDKGQSNLSPQFLVALAGVHTNVAERFEKAGKPYRVISCFQKCASNSPHSQIVGEPCARTFATGEILVGLDRHLLQLHEALGLEEGEFWRIQFEDAHTRSLSAYKELTQALDPGFPRTTPRSRQTYHNLVERIFARETVKGWCTSSARRQVFLRLLMPDSSVRLDVLGTALATGLSKIINTNSLFPPITLYLDAADIERESPGSRTACKAYGLLCAGLLSQQPSLAARTLDIDPLDIMHTRGQRLLSILTEQLRALLIKLLCCQNVNREVYIVITISSPSELVQDVLSTLSSIVQLTDTRVTVILLQTSSSQEEPVFCDASRSDTPEFCSERIESAEISTALDHDIKDWLTGHTTPSKLFLDKEAESEAFQKLKNSVSSSETEQFLVYLEQASKEADSPIQPLPLYQSSARFIARIIRRYGHWLLVALVWIYNASRPLTLEQLDEAVDFDLTLGPELLRVLSSSAPQSAQDVHNFSERIPTLLRRMVARDIVQVLPGVVVVDNGFVFPLDERLRQFLKNPENLEPILASSPSGHLALSCFLQIKYELLRQTDTGATEVDGKTMVRQSSLAPYAFASWATHYSDSFTPDSSSNVHHDAILAANSTTSLESLIVGFLNNSAEEEKWLKLVRFSAAKLSNGKVVGGLAPESDALPGIVQSQLSLSHRQAACLSTTLATRLDTWNSAYDSLLLKAIDEGDRSLYEALCKLPKGICHTYKTETIARALLEPSPHTNVLFDGKLQDLFTSLPPSMTLYSIASRNPEIIDSILTDLGRTQHARYLLHRASRLGDLPIVKKVLTGVGDSVDDGISTGGLSLKSESLLLAAVSGQLEVVQKALELGARINCCAESGLTALMLASMNGFTTIVRLLLTKEELDINAKNHVTGNSALHLASRGGSIKTVRLLLEHHADPLMENSSGFLPLHLAFAQGHSEVASFLVDRMEGQVTYTTVPLREPTYRESKTATRRPRDYDSDGTDTDSYPETESDSDSDSDTEQPATKNDSSGGRAEEPVRLFCPFNTAATSGMTALLLAARRCYAPICKAMIAKHADVNLVDSSKRSALHHAAEIGSEDLVRLLLEERADPSLESNSGQIALDYASLYGHDGVVRLLLEHDNDLIKRLDEDDESPPLNAALSPCQTHVVCTLVKAFLKNGITHSGLTLGLQRAVRMQNTSVVELLLDNGVDINAVDQYKNTALHFAAFGDRVNMAKLLVMRNARLDCPDNGGFTPLMDAARTGSLSSMKVLIDAGANLEALNDSGLSALDLAIKNKKVKCRQLLLAKLAQHSSAWMTPSNKNLRQYLRFAIKSSNTNIAMTILLEVIGKESESGFRPSSKELISSLLWKKWSSVLELVLVHWDVSSLHLGVYGTALHYAAMRHQSPVVEQILKHPKHPIKFDTKAGIYGTPLQAAIASQPKAQRARECLATIELLLSQGADPTIVGEGITGALQAAAYNRHRVVVKILLEKLGRKDVLRTGGQFGTVLQALISGPKEDDDEVGELFHLLIKHGESVMRKGGSQDLTALHRAARFASLPIVKLVREQPDVHINQPDRMGCLPIHHAVRQQRSRLDIVRALDPHLETLWKSDHLKRSILHMAAAAGALDVVEEVLRVASQTEPTGDIVKLVNEPDVDGWTPLHWACRSHAYYADDVLKLLLKNGADKTKTTKKGWLPRHVAIFHGSRGLLPFLGGEREEEGDSEESEDSDHSTRGSDRGELPTQKAENTHTGCDSCLCSNYGDAWHCTTCTNECPQDEFDLCFKCFPHRAIVHPPSHVFESLTDGWYWSYHQERRLALGLGHDARSDSDSDFSDSSDSSGSDSN